MVRLVCRPLGSRSSRSGGVRRQRREPHKLLRLGSIPSPATMRFRRRPSGLFLPEHEVRGFRGVGARGLASIAVSRKTVAVGAQGGGGGGADAGQSTVAVSRSVMGLNRPNGATAYTSTITLTARDSAGDLVGAGGATVAFDLGAGTSVGTIGAVTDVGDGTYTATFTPTGTGTPRTVTATVNGATVTTSMPTITVAWF